MAWLKFTVLSLAAHTVLTAAVWMAPKRPSSLEDKKVQVRIVKQKPKPVELVEEKPKPETPKPKPVPPKPKKKPKPKPKPTERKQLVKKPKKKVQPIQGVSKNAVSAKGKGITVPVGNTLMVEDTGKRVNPDEVEELDADLSAEAKLLRQTVKKPDYTPEALDIGLEGTFTVEVFVDEQGNVADVELVEKIGYGMDKNLLEAARQAKFIPRKNRYGKAIAGWTSIKFALIIE